MEIFALEIVVENNSNGGIYNPKEICLLAAGKGSFVLPVDRPVDRPNCHFYDRCASGRPPDRRGLDTESSSSLPVDRPVDRGHFQRAKLSAVDWVGQPAYLPGLLGQSTRRSTVQALWKWPRSTGRSTGRELLLSVSSPGRPEAQRA